MPFLITSFVGDAHSAFLETVHMSLRRHASADFHKICLQREKMPVCRTGVYHHRKTLDERVWCIS